MDVLVCTDDSHILFLKTMTGNQVNFIYFINDVDFIIILYIFVVVKGFYDLESYTSCTLDLAKFACLIVHGKQCCLAVRKTITTVEHGVRLHLLSYFTVTDLS